MTQEKAKVDVGKIVTTPGAQETLQPRDILNAIAQHAYGEWGDCGPEDAAANERALEDGSRIFSVYHSQGGVKFWVITEAVGDDGRRASTCVLLPSEY